MSEQLCPRDLAILECGGMAIPPTISLAVEAAEPLAANGSGKRSKAGENKGYNITPTSQGTASEYRPKTFADRIAGSPQLVEGTITRAIRLAAHRERLAALKPVMAVRFAGSK
ncbi:MAG: hypothetical protein ABGX07_20605 [Pirellulaceae bacterium]